jgi:predicted small lipoprotein YifL
MKIGGPRFFQRSVLLAVTGILVAVLTACTGKGGGYLPPDEVSRFTGQAPFGFTFSCEDKGGLNPPTGQLAIELAYSDLGTSTFLGAPFSIHGIVDTIDQVVESAICIGQNPPPDGSTLIFLGRYWSTTSPPPPGFPSTCPTSQKKGTPLCRFEVTVRDNDGNLKPSAGDFFSIKLSSATAVTSELDPAKVFYARAGELEGGNLTVK